MWLKRKDFYSTKEWKHLREWALNRYGARCMRCKRFKDIQVDHIRSRKLYPRLKLRRSNVQILCLRCNRKKGYIDQTDYRPWYWKLYYFIVRWVMRAVIIGVMFLLCYAATEFVF